MNDPRAALRNVVLIGMPGAGKSTVGVLLAKALARQFVDTDLLLQAAGGAPLHKLLADLGTAGFRALEERQILALTARDTVIATGGSVVYSAPAMAHLRTLGRLVYLELPLATLQQRLGDLRARGVVMAPGQTLAALYAERVPLYRQYAELTVPCAGLSHYGCVSALLERLQDAGFGEDLR
jgi:shikimate kinase